MNDRPFRPTPAPLYRQIEEHLARQIYDGVLKPGARLPSDAQLCAMFGVSRITVRTAVDRLVSANLIRRQQGIGSFVVGPEDGVQTTRLVGHIDDVHPHMNFTSMEATRRPLPAGVAAALGLDEAALLRCFVGVNRVGAEPLSYLEDYYPDDLAHFIGEEDFLGVLPPVRLIEMRSGRHFNHAKQKIDAVAAPEHVAEALGLSVGQPIIRMERIYFALDKSILDIAIAHYHPRRYQFEIKIVPQVRGSAGPKRNSAASERVARPQQR